MNPLSITGYSCDMHVDNGILLVREWVFEDNKGKEHLVRLKPKQHTYDSIILHTDKGNISLSAMQWLNRYNIPIVMLDLKGNIIMQTQNNNVNAELRIKQVKGYNDPKTRIGIGKEIIKAKIQRQSDTLDYLANRYGIDNSLNPDKVMSAKSQKEILGLEGIASNNYWAQISKIVKGFQRDNGFTHRPMNAVDPFNASLNYGYGMLAGIVRNELNGIGLDTHIGFVHEIGQGKEPLVYDMQEPYRFLVDLTAIRCYENSMFDKQDFIHNRDWIVSLSESGIDKMLRELQLTFNTRAKYHGKEWKWDNIIGMKARELANGLDSCNIDFSMPKLEIKRNDNKELRDRISKIKYSDWAKLGYSKGTLHYLKHNLDSLSFKVYEPVLRKLEEIAK